MNQFELIFAIICIVLGGFCTWYGGFGMIKDKKVKPIKIKRKDMIVNVLKKKDGNRCFACGELLEDHKDDAVKRLKCMSDIQDLAISEALENLKEDKN